MPKHDDKEKDGGWYIASPEKKAELTLMQQLEDRYGLESQTLAMLTKEDSKREQQWRQEREQRQQEIFDIIHNRPPLAFIPSPEDKLPMTTPNNQHLECKALTDFQMTAYADGSFFETEKVAGSCVWFHSGHYIYQDYDPKLWGSDVSPLRAELFAALLAVREVYNLGVVRVKIIQDCQEAMNILKAINNRQGKLQKIKDVEIEKDPIFLAWWKLIQYVEVVFEKVDAHTEAPKDNNSAEYAKWFGNKQADYFAGHASHCAKYKAATQRCDNTSRCDPTSQREVKEERNKKIIHSLYKMTKTNPLSSFTKSAILHPRSGSWYERNSIVPDIAELDPIVKSHLATLEKFRSMKRDRLYRLRLSKKGDKEYPLMKYVVDEKYQDRPETRDLAIDRLTWRQVNDMRSHPLVSGVLQGLLHPTLPVFHWLKEK